MRIKLYDFNDLTDSRLLLEHRLLPITLWFIYGLMAFLIALILWSYFGEIDVVVKARGIVRPVDAIGTITSKSTGKISTYKVIKDQRVSKGDLIMTLDDSVFQVQKNTLLVEKNQMKSELILATRFIKGLNSGLNPFDQASEETYYYQFEKYRMDYQLNAATVTLNADKLSRCQNDLQEIQTLLTWIEQNSVLKKDDHSAVGRKYKQFIMEKEKLSRKVNTSKANLNTLKTLYDSGNVSMMELDAAKIEFDNSKLALDAYETSYISSLIDKRSLLQGQLSDFQNTNIQSTQSTGIGNQINWQSTKSTLEKNIDLMNEKLKGIELSIAHCKVYATLNGIYSPVADFAVGDQLAEGTKIGIIVPETSHTFQTEITVSNQDVGRISKGDIVNLKLDALPYKEYGFIKAKIISISPDASLDQSTGLSYYKVVADFKNRPLKSYKGIEKSIKVGMSCEAHIVTEHKKIIRLIFEKLQLSL